MGTIAGAEGVRLSPRVYVLPVIVVGPFFGEQDPFSQAPYQPKLNGMGRSQRRQEVYPHESASHSPLRLLQAMRRRCEGPAGRPRHEMHSRPRGQRHHWRKSSKEVSAAASAAVGKRLMPMRAHPWHMKQNVMCSPRAGAINAHSSFHGCTTHKIRSLPAALYTAYAPHTFHVFQHKSRYQRETHCIELTKSIRDC